jgi:hypothetical protein
VDLGTFAVEDRGDDPADAGPQQENNIASIAAASEPTFARAPSCSAFGWSGCFCEAAARTGRSVGRA